MIYLASAPSVINWAAVEGFRSGFQRLFNTVLRISPNKVEAPILSDLLYTLAVYEEDGDFSTSDLNQALDQIMKDLNKRAVPQNSRVREAVIRAQELTLKIQPQQLWM